jgi:Raf kinase inhibitor-like YbhB/YbcL family protein
MAFPYNTYDHLPKLPTFTLTSESFTDGGAWAGAQVSGIMGAGGDDISPQLSWSGFPAETRSFAVTVYDPDAPTGSGWWHWSVINIPADVTELKPDAGNASNANLPAGARQVRIDYGVAAWGGYCPPEGDRPHRYVFTLYALKADKLDIPADATAALAGFMIHANTLAKASFTAKYGRPKAKK